MESSSSSVVVTNQPTFCKIVGLVVCSGKIGHRGPIHLGAVSYDYGEQFGRYDR